MSCPILFVHGKDDKTVPFTDALRLAEASGLGGAACLEVPGGHDLTEGLGRITFSVWWFLRSSLSLKPK